MLHFKNVSYGYDGGLDVLREVTFTVAQGEWVALMGANGCGKSTVAKLACGLLQPTGGSVSAPKVGFVAQDPEANIVGDTVFEDVAYGLSWQGKSRESLFRRVGDCLALVGLSGYERRAMHTLSGGELQRAAVAAALAADVDLLVLDEPTSHLPRHEAETFFRALKQVAASRFLGLLYVTHHPEEARLAKRVIVLAHGRIALEAPPEQALFRDELLAHLGVRPDLRLCIERLLPARPGDSGALTGSDDYERLVEQVCSALKA